MPFNRPSENQITSWPPKEKPRQVTREELRRMTPEAIQQARELGAVIDVMSGKKDAEILEERGA